MKIGISFYFGYKLKTKEAVKLLKEHNFESVMTIADKKFTKTQGAISKQVKYFKKYNIELSSLHMRYEEGELPNFWVNNKIGDKLESNLKKDLKIAKKYGFKCVVVHLKGEYSDIGVNRINRLLKIAREINVPLAIENIDCQDLFIKVMDSIDDDYLKFCYDSGHNNCFDPEYNYLSKYGDRLVALHLHDNDGLNDDHTLNRLGNIDWDKISLSLSQCPNVNLDYELLMHKGRNMNPKEVLQECHKQGNELLKKIKEKRISLFH